MNKFVVFLLIFSTTFFSCKKQKDAVISYMVKTKTSSQNNNNTETYTYDSENRITKITNSNFTTFTTFEYVGDSVFQYSYKDDSSFYLNTKYLFNTKKLQIEKLQLSPFTFNLEEERFSYEPNDFLKTYFYSITDYATNDTLFNDGTNFTKRIAHFSGLIGYGISTTNYTYFSNTNTIGNENFGRPFLGKSSENILKSETTKSTNLFQVPIIETTSTTNYTYEFDNFGRVATQYITTDALNIKNTFTYY